MEYTLYKRKLAKGTFYYARFRESGTEWSSGINTGQTTQPSASAWALNYCATVARELIPTLNNYSKDFFHYTVNTLLVENFLEDLPQKYLHWQINKDA